MAPKTMNLDRTISVTCSATGLGQLIVFQKIGTLTHPMASVSIMSHAHRSYLLIIIARTPQVRKVLVGRGEGCKVIGKWS